MTPWKTSCCRGQRDDARSFNGATAVRPWKTVRPESTGGALQWGHGDDAVENGRIGDIRIPMPASMGPRR